MTADQAITAADIARLAGVGRAAVSNWRRRHPDFPRPSGGTAASPTFEIDEVQRWLLANGRLPVQDIGAFTSAEASGSSPSPLARAVAALLPPLSSGLIVDPACESGDALAAAAARFGDHVAYIGQCLTPGGAPKVERLLKGLTQTARVVDGKPFDDTLADHFGQADAVVSMPPAGQNVIVEDAFHDRWEFGPPAKGDTALAWVQAAYSYLRPGGVGVVVTPFTAAARASGRRVRAELLRAGALTHIIALPGDLLAPSQIWVLKRPSGKLTYMVCMVDLTQSSPSEVPVSPEAWQSVFAQAAFTSDVPSIELLDEEVLLVPSAHVIRPPRDVAPEYEKLAARYADLIKALEGRAPTFAADTPADMPTVSIADLQRAGALDIRERQEAQPGDVVVPGGVDRFDAITVLSDSHNDLRSGVLLRCDADQIDPYFLACFLRSEANRRQAVGTQSGSFRLDLRRARVPRIPLAQQRRFGESFRRLIEFADRTDELAASASELVRTAVYGLTSGVLTTTALSEDTSDHSA